MNIAIIGAGGVAQTFVSLVEQSAELLKKENLPIKILCLLNSKGGFFCENGIEYSAIQNIPLSQHPNYHFGMTIQQVLHKNIDLVIDLKHTDIETAEADVTRLLFVLNEGVHVVCANKAPVVSGYKRLKAAAKANHVHFLCGCAAGAALPSINTGLYGLAGSQITGIQGVLNGTSNYILAEMEKGLSFEEALLYAQSQGIAEQNPSYDAEGTDTAVKTLILSNILWDLDLKISNVKIEGIQNVLPLQVLGALKNDEKIKLVGKAQIDDTGCVNVTVKPTLLTKQHPLYSIDGKNKAVLFNTTSFGDICISGGASSLKGAAAAVLRDIVNISRGVAL